MFTLFIIAFILLAVGVTLLLRVPNLMPNKPSAIVAQTRSYGFAVDRAPEPVDTARRRPISGVAASIGGFVERLFGLGEHSMRRLYLAVVQGDPPASGVIDAPVGRDVRARTRMAVTHRGKPSRTNYRVLERYGHAALVECRLETGRTHQIRVHFQHLRHPLVGDETYRRGTRHGISFPRQALHATELTLVHPGTHQPMTWSAPLPRDLKRLIEDLRK